MTEAHQMNLENSMVVESFHSSNEHVNGANSNVISAVGNGLHDASNLQQSEASMLSNSIDLDDDDDDDDMDEPDPSQPNMPLKAAKAKWTEEEVFRCTQFTCF